MRKGDPTPKQMKHFWGLVERRLITSANFQPYLDKRGSVNIYEVVVDYDQPFAKMIEACKLDWVNEDITVEHFPVKSKGKKKVKLQLYQFDRMVTGTEASKLLDEAGYRPANPAELLAFGKKFLDKQRQFPIVAMGSSWRSPDGRLYVPVLYEDADERDLDLHWLGGDFGPHCRFLVVGKSA
ncbi:hypothetical protein KJ969_02910 [Patescibacteria group bacterium]|nr:hypothetical protein [Patescibacteria group bacterium]MBU1922170.1 hypothetical protein [Patescibacteria group bacterium]